MLMVIHSQTDKLSVEFMNESSKSYTYLHHLISAKINNSDNITNFQQHLNSARFLPAITVSISCDILSQLLVPI